MKIRTKLLVIILSIILIGGSGIIAVSTAISQNIIKDEVYSMLQSTAESRARHIQTLLSSDKNSIEVLATSFILKGFLATSKEDSNYPA